MRGKNKTECLSFIPGRMREFESPRVSDNHFKSHHVFVQAAPEFEARSKRYPNHLPDDSPKVNPVLIVPVSPYPGTGRFYGLVEVPERFKGGLS